jgi:RNA polymerase sigma factor (TIGR02999 family)
MSDSSTQRQKIDSLLEAFSHGDRGAMDELIPLIEPELRRLARYNLRFRHRDQTLDTTALIHEVYLKLVTGPPPDWKNRAYFFGTASQLMRQILVKHIRDNPRFEKLMIGREEVGPDDLAEEKDRTLLLLNEALNKLARLNETEARVVELRYFGGLKHEEVAQVLGISLRTVKRLWKHAKAWLRREIKGDEDR